MPEWCNKGMDDPDLNAEFTFLVEELWIGEYLLLLNLEIMECQLCIQNGILAGVALMACLHGLLLGAILAMSPRLRSKSTRFLALALVGVAFMLLYEFFYYAGIEEIVPDPIYYLLPYLRTSLPIGIFYFVVFLIQPDHQLHRWEKSGYWVLLIDFLLDALNVPVYWTNPETMGGETVETLLDFASEGVGLLASLFFLSAALFRVRSYQTFLFTHYSNTTRKNLVWLQTFIWLVLGVLLIWLISSGQYLMNQMNAYEFTSKIMLLGLVGLLFWIGYFVILQYQWFELVPLPEEAVAKAPEENKLSAKTETYFEEVLELMENKKLFEDPDLTLDRLSERLQISSGYLSQIISEKAEKNFFEFVNHYRIEAVKHKLLDPAFGHYTILGIAQESGFQSKSTFNAVFKKIAGMTPSEFKRKSRTA
ncbi:MAG: AraC family transcriptional regulator [Bacteroidota bacterium]